jgi:thioredoxin-related protein
VKIEMKRHLILALTFLIFLPITIFAQEQISAEQSALRNFETVGKTNTQILAILNKANKPGFLYFTTDWCGWCKVLEKNTFENIEVKQYLEAHFIPFLINAEKNTGPDLNKFYNVTSYPTVVIVSPTGIVIDKLGGYEKPEPYLIKLKNVVNGIDTIERLKNDYESDPDNEAKGAALAKKYLSSDDYTSAEPILEKLLATSRKLKETPDFLFGLSQYYFIRESSHAAPFLERIIREFPDYPNMELVYRDLGRVYAEFNREPCKRIELYEDGIKKGVLKQNVDNARLTQAIDSVAVKEWNNALAYLEKISKAFAQRDPSVPLLRSYCLMQVGQEKQGHALLDELYSAGDADLQKRLKLIGWCLELKIYLKESLIWMEPVVAQDGGKSNEILYGYARLLALNGRKPEALGIMEKAVGMTPEGQIRTIMNKELAKLRKEVEKK